jgi:hypothetical protein
MVPRGFRENDDRLGREVDGGHEAGKAGAPALALQLLDRLDVGAEDGPLDRRNDGVDAVIESGGWRQGASFLTLDLLIQGI